MNQVNRQRRPLGGVLLEFLGSMNLAITLLVVIAIASVIGTVLQQNQPYNDYIIKFGPFWFEVFKSLGLFDIYGAPWFMFLLGFLLISTSVCIWRNAPTMLRDMRHFRLEVQEKSLRAFKHSARWTAEGGVDTTVDQARRLLEGRGYRTRVKQGADGTVVAGMKGSGNRLGYLMSHLAIVVICVGALVDGNLPLKIAEWRGELKIDTSDTPAGAMPPESTVSAENAAFRGNVRIPEGSQADFVFLNLRDGFLLQKLPFSVELEDFRIEHYPSGQPKSFESDVVIHDPEEPEPIRTTIAVNHPLVHKGYAIYQASFADGGSNLTLRAWSLDRPDAKPVMLNGDVYQQLQLQTPRGRYSVELNDFKLYNIFPADDDPDRKFRNFGPSVVFKLRNEAGEALEFTNYMAPIDRDGATYYLSGMRTSPAEPFRYLYIPADPDGGVERFMKLREMAMDEALVRRTVAERIGPQFNSVAEGATLEQSVLGLVDVFLRGGMDGLVSQTDASVPEAQRSDAMQSFIVLLQTIFGSLYVDLLQQEGVQVTEGISPVDSRWFDDALEAMAQLGGYQSPLFVELTDFEHVEASGFQITKAPGQDIVYLGFVMLMVGVFFMFYVHHRRVWVRITPEQEGAGIVLAGAGTRDRVDFGPEFEQLRQGLSQITERENKSAKGE